MRIWFYLSIPFEVEGLGRGKKLGWESIFKISSPRTPAFNGWRFSIPTAAFRTDSTANTRRLIYRATVPPTVFLPFVFTTGKLSGTEVR